MSTFSRLLKNWHDFLDTANVVARARKTIAWFLSGVIIGSMPIAILWLFAVQRHDGIMSSVTLTDIFGKGDLFLLATAISGGAIGELIGSQSTWLTTKRFFTCSCVAVVIFSSCWYGAMQNDIGSVGKINFDIYGSIWAYSLSALFGAGCIYLSEDKKA